MDTDASGILQHEMNGSVLVLSLENPPVQALDAAARRALFDALEEADADPAVTAIVLTGASGATFFTSDDLRRALKPEDAPSLGALCLKIAELSKPVVACLVGRVTGAGASLALAAHWRVAGPTVRLGWPDVGLGRVPGAGATQRLPRLVGAQAALDVFLTGRAFLLSKPMLAALVDREAPADAVLDTAIAFAEEPGCTLRPTDARRDGLLEGTQYSREIAIRRDVTGTAEGDAAAQTVASVEAALVLPIEAGLTFESTVAAECASSPTTLARHRLAIAERQISVRDVERAEARIISIAGSGAGAPGLAVAALDAGERVQLLGPTCDRVARQIKSTYDHALARDRLSEKQRDVRMARMSVIQTDADLQSATVVLVTDTSVQDWKWPGEAILAVQDDVLWAPDGTLPSLRIAAAMPAHARRLVELRAPGNAAEPVMAAVTAAMLHIGRLPLRSSGAGPTCLTRLSAVMSAAADCFVVAGVPPERVDAALKDAGWAALPYQTRDLRGLSGTPADPDLVALFPGVDLTRLDAAMIAAGRSGRLSGAGYYDYSSGRASADPAITAILSDTVEPTDPGTAGSKIVWAITAALANEGVRILAEGAMPRALDLDLVAIHGLGLPRDSGGILGWADAQGATHMLRELKRLEGAHGPLWHPHPRWQEVIKNGQALVEDP